MNARCAEMRDIRMTTAVSRITTAAALTMAATSIAESVWWNPPNKGGDGVTWADGNNWTRGTAPTSEDVAKFAQQGVAIMMISSEMEEVINLSDRIVVLHEGNLTGVLDNPPDHRVTQEEILLLASGGKKND